MAPLLNSAALHSHSSLCPLRRLPCALVRAAAPAAAQDAGAAPARVRVGMVQLGCPKNTVDAEVVLGHLAAADFEVSERLEDAEVLIVNTCSFIDEAKAESLEVCAPALPSVTRAPLQHRILQRPAPTCTLLAVSSLLKVCAVQRCQRSVVLDTARMVTAPPCAGRPSWTLRS